MPSNETSGLVAIGRTSSIGTVKIPKDLARPDWTLCPNDPKLLQRRMSECVVCTLEVDATII